MALAVGLDESEAWLTGILLCLGDVLVAQGKLRPRETIAQGIENAPEAFLGLLSGKNFGKQLVKLGLGRQAGEESFFVERVKQGGVLSEAGA